MTTLQAAIRLVSFAWVFAAAALIGYGLLTGAINTQGLLRSKTAKGLGSVSPERVLLLVSTLAVAATYVAQVLSAPASHALPTLPALPATAIGAVGGSNVVYLLGKALKVFQDRRASREP